MVVKRATIATCNILFPPIAVWMLCGAGEDLLISSVLFLLAVIPSHIHGFYLSWTYFNRKRKIRKGEYPGRWRPMIFSSKIQNGGASSKEVRQFKKDREREKSEKLQLKEQEGGRVRRLLRRLVHRKSARSYDIDEGYIEPITPSNQSSTVQRRISQQQNEPLMVSRNTSRRNSYTSPTEVIDAPRRHESSRRSHPPRAILQSSLLKRSGTDQRVHSRRNSIHGEAFDHSNRLSLKRGNTLESRRNSVGRSTSSDASALADYVARPALPVRPGSSYRDDIEQWRRSVPVDVD